MGQTKINYNSCNFNDGLPVTVRFANMVGGVLTMGSAKGADRQPFKFYVQGRRNALRSAALIAPYRQQNP